MKTLHRFIATLLLSGGALFAAAGCTSTSGLYEPGSTTQGRSGNTTVVIHSGYYGRGFGYPGYYPGGAAGPPPYGW